MATEVIATRYAQVLFEAAQTERRIEETLEHLMLLGRLIREEPALRALLWNPDVDPEEKVGVLDRVFHGSWSALVRAFLRMVASLGRAELLPEIVDAFATRVDEAQGRLRVLVRSAHPLPDGALERLRSRLEHQERRPDRHGDDPVGALDHIAVFDVPIRAEDDRADVVLLEVEDHPHRLSRKLEELAGHRILEPVEPGDPIPDLDDPADGVELHLAAVALELLRERQ